MPAPRRLPIIAPFHQPPAKKGATMAPITSRSITLCSPRV
ncbi:hypothetical protein HMPREF9120_02270 [Neisseria sp. oral taxon 020 str. F0370]|nr:hypothetical protein HMPREF9120_02270 [Neisseria sp. oral taxon 020 str. F0370]